MVDMQAEFPWVIFETIEWNIVCEWNEPIRLQVPFEIPFHFVDIAGHPVLETPMEDDYEVKITSNKGKFELIDKKVKLNSKNIPELVCKFTLLSTTEKFKWTKTDKDMVKMIPALLDVKKNNDNFPPVQLNFSAKVGKPETILVFPGRDEGNIEIENGTLPLIGVKVLDKCHNLVTCDIEPKLQSGVIVEFYEEDGKKISTHTLDFNTGPDGTPMNLKGSNVLKFPLGKEYMKKEVIARIYLKEFKDVKPRDRIVVIRPSCKPASMKLFYRADIGDDNVPASEKIISELRQGEEVEWTAGEMIRNVTFQLFDESGKQIKKPSFRSNDMKISWKHSKWVEATGWKPHMLNDEKLPDVRSPRQAGTTLNCTVTFFTSDKGTSKDDFTFDFKVKSIPGDPAKINLSVENGTVQKTLKLQAGDLSTILVQIADKLDNGCNNITEDDIDELKVSCITGYLMKGSIKKIKGNKVSKNYYTLQFCQHQHTKER